MAWLPRYGQHLTSLYCTGFPHQQPLWGLPCLNLLELRALSSIVQLGRTFGDGCPGLIEHCTKLTHLELRKGTYSADGVAFGEGNQVYGLSGLVQLQHLAVRLSNPLALSSATLARLQHLTYLEVDCLTHDNLLQLGALSRLRKLHLIADHTFTSRVAVGPSSIPGLLLPASLETLLLSSPVEAGIFALVPTGLQELQILFVVHSPIEEPGAFLSRMTRLQRLTRLSFKLHPRAGIKWPADAPAFSALTASSNLVHLEILNVRWPEGIWRHVFSPQHKLLHLTCLIFSQRAAPVPSWGVLEISSLVSCCPSLCQAGMLTLQPGLHVSELHKLTALTSLTVSCPCDGGDDGGGDGVQPLVGGDGVEPHVLGLAAVTQLKRLVLKQASQEFQAVSMLPLTRLKALTKMAFSWGPIDNENEGVGWDFDAEVGQAIGEQWQLLAIY
jgi:hypothetical protein